MTKREVKERLERYYREVYPHGAPGRFTCFKAENYGRETILVDGRREERRRGHLVECRIYAGGGRDWKEVSEIEDNYGGDLALPLRCCRDCGRWADNWDDALILALARLWELANNNHKPKLEAIIADLGGLKILAWAVWPEVPGALIKAGRAPAPTQPGPSPSLSTYQGKAG